MLALASFALVGPFQAAAEPPKLASTVVVDVQAPLLDIALDGSGATLFTLTDKGLLAARKRADGQELWRSEQPALVAIECGPQALVAMARMPLAATFDLRTGATLEELEGSNDEPVTAVALAAQSPWVWAGTSAGVVQMASQKSWSFHPIDNDGVTALALDEKGETLAIGGQNGSVRLVPVPRGEFGDEKVLSAAAQAITALAFGPRVLVTAGADGPLRLWNTSSGMQKAELSQSGVAVRVLAVASKADWFASGDADGNVILWQLSNGVARAHWKNDRPGTPIVALAFAPDAKTLLAAAGTRVLAVDLAAVK